MLYMCQMFRCFYISEKCLVFIFCSTRTTYTLFYALLYKPIFHRIDFLHEHKIWIIRYINHNRANHFQCVCITELKLNLYGSFFYLAEVSIRCHTYMCIHIHWALSINFEQRALHRSWSTWSQSHFFFLCSSFEFHF